MKNTNSLLFCVYIKSSKTVFYNTSQFGADVFQVSPLASGFFYWTAEVQGQERGHFRKYQ